MPNEAAPPPLLRLAVDAGNLARDRRGMGRIARGVLRAALDAPDVEVTLLADRAADAAAVSTEFPRAAVAATASARRKRRYDVVWFPFNGVRFPCAAPTLVTLHDVFAFTEPHGEAVARWREQTPIRRAARHATRILTDSAWSRAEIERELGVPGERIRVIHPSPDPYWFPARGDELPRPLANARVALLVGAREPRKNARTALAAAGKALRGPGELLAVVGELSSADRAFAKRERVPAGEIAASDRLLRALYRQAALVLVPSLAEGFGLVAVEAMACGAAVIAADAAALPEATGGAALLVDPRDTGGWAAAIRRLLDDPSERALWAARGTARFAFADRGASAKATLQLLREVADPGATARDLVHERREAALEWFGTK